MRAESPVVEPGQNAVRVGPAVLSTEEQQRVDAEVARLTALSPSALGAVVKEALEIGGIIRLAAIAQISETNKAVADLIADVRKTPAITNMGRADQPIDPDYPDARERNGRPSREAMLARKV